MGKPKGYLGEEVAKAKVLGQEGTLCVRGIARRRPVYSEENGKRKKWRFESSRTLSYIIVNFQVLRLV